MAIESPNNTLRVLLVDDRTERYELLESALKKVACSLVACVSSDADLLATVERYDPDVVLIDLEAPTRDTLESLESVQSRVPRPVVLFSQDDDHRTIRRAIRAGVSAYVVDGLSSARVRSIIDAAVARFERFNQLKTELDKTRQELRERKTIDKAKGIVMQRQGVSEEQAYQAMRKLAMDSNQRLVDVAQSLIDAATILTR